MKKILLTSFLISFCAMMSVAQTRRVQKEFKVNSTESITLNLKFGQSIIIKAWDKDNVSFKADVKINDGKLNNALKLNYNQDGDGLEISSDYDQKMLKNGRSQDCPKGYSTYSRSNDGEVQYAVCSSITYEVYVPRNADINVKTISGNIEMQGLRGPVQAKSISGFVDLSWPVSRPASIDLKTISGEAYTDIDALKFINKKDHIPLVGYKINAKIGSGGPHVSLKSISGNIYLRKG